VCVTDFAVVTDLSFNANPAHLDLPPRVVGLVALSSTSSDPLIDFFKISNVFPAILNAGRTHQMDLALNDKVVEPTIGNHLALDCGNGPTIEFVLALRLKANRYLLERARNDKPRWFSLNIAAQSLHRLNSFFKTPFS
jgi:hypothetical protein